MTLVEEVSLAQDLPWRTQQLKRLAAWLCLPNEVGVDPRPPSSSVYYLCTFDPSQTDCFLIELN